MHPFSSLKTFNHNFLKVNIFFIVGINGNSGVNARFIAYVTCVINIGECGSTLYVGLACAVPPTNTNFRLTLLLTQLEEALYEDLPV